MRRNTHGRSGWTRTRRWVAVPAVLLAGAAVAVTIDHAATQASATTPKTKPGHHHPPKGDSGPEFSTEKWGTIGRNTIGSATALPRTGPWGSAPQPSDPPSGVGSLQITVGDGTQKVAYGNQHDFYTTRLNTVSTLTYWVYRDIDVGIPAILPSVAFEVLSPTTAVGYTSLVYVPAPATTPVAVWTKLDALAGAQWFFTNGALAASSGCNQTTYCTFAQATAALTNPGYRILSLAVSKGRDTAFNGAVDALQVNRTLYDFEPQGVVERRAH